ncbi:MAG: hypothetical protein U0175_08745 [Caldilineaceae bacterium]
MALKLVETEVNNGWTTAQVTVRVVRGKSHSDEKGSRDQEVEHPSLLNKQLVYLRSTNLRLINQIISRLNEVESSKYIKIVSQEKVSNFIVSEVNGNIKITYYEGNELHKSYHESEVENLIFDLIHICRYFSLLQIQNRYEDSKLNRQIHAYIGDSVVDQMFNKSVILDIEDIADITVGNNHEDAVYIYVLLFLQDGSIVKISGHDEVLLPGWTRKIGAPSDFLEQVKISLTEAKIVDHNTLKIIATTEEVNVDFFRQRTWGENSDFQNISIDDNEHNRPANRLDAFMLNLIKGDITKDLEVISRDYKDFWTSIEILVDIGISS